MRDQVTGAVFKVTKGAPHVILKLVQKANDSMISQVRMDLFSLSVAFVQLLILHSVWLQLYIT